MKREFILSLITSLLITQTTAVIVLAEPVDTVESIDNICMDCEGEHSEIDAAFPASDYESDDNIACNAEEMEIVDSDMGILELEGVTDTVDVSEDSISLTSDETDAIGTTTAPGPLKVPNIIRVENTKEGVRVIPEDINEAMQYTIERSTNGKDYKVIGCCDGNGGGCKPVNWEPVTPMYIDKTVEDGVKYWYRAYYCTDWGNISKRGESMSIKYVNNDIVKPTKVTLNKSKITATAGDVYQKLIVKITPKNAVSEYSFSSSDEKVASVTQTGFVVFNKAGKATITVKTWNGKTAKCEVTVKEHVNVKEIKLNKKSAKIRVGERIKLHADVFPFNATNPGVLWDVNNDNVDMEGMMVKIADANVRDYADISHDIYITGNKPGTTIVTAETCDGEKIAKCEITVTAIPAKSIKLNKTKVTLKKGETVNLKATLTPKKATKKVKWASSNKQVAKVSSNGKVTALKRGTAIIIATTKYGKKKATCKITVK